MIWDIPCCRERRPKERRPKCHIRWHIFYVYWLRGPKGGGALMCENGLYFSGLILPVSNINPSCCRLIGLTPTPFKQLAVWILTAKLTPSYSCRRYDCMVASASPFVGFHALFHRVINWVVRSHRASMSSRPRPMATKNAWTEKVVPSVSGTSVLRTELVSGNPCLWHHARVDPRISLV